MYLYHNIYSFPKNIRQISSDVSVAKKTLLAEYGAYIFQQENYLFNVHIVFPGPPNTPYEGGLYHVIIQLSQLHPHILPKIFMITPSGRFKTELYPSGKSRGICAPLTEHYPKPWKSIYGIDTVFRSFISCMCDDDNIGEGLIVTSTAERKKLAKESLGRIAYDRELQWSIPGLVDTILKGKYAPPKLYSKNKKSKEEESNESEEEDPLEDEDDKIELLKKVILDLLDSELKKINEKDLKMSTEIASIFTLSEDDEGLREISDEKYSDKGEEPSEEEVPVKNLTIFLVGEVSSGKSSLLNALSSNFISNASLQRETLNLLTYNFNNKGEESNIETITKDLENIHERNVTNGKELNSAHNITIGEPIIYDNLPSIHDIPNLTIIDFPGLNDSDDKSNVFFKLIEDNISKANLVIYVSDSSNSMINNSEVQSVLKLKELIELKKEKIHKVIDFVVVVNKFDDFANDIDIHEIYERISSKIQMDSSKIFRISSHKLLIDLVKKSESKLPVPKFMKSEISKILKNAGVVIDRDLKYNIQKRYCLLGSQIEYSEIESSISSLSEESAYSGSENDECVESKEENSHLKNNRYPPSTEYIGDWDGFIDFLQSHNDNMEDLMMVFMMRKYDTLLISKYRKECNPGSHISNFEKWFCLFNDINSAYISYFGKFPDHRFGPLIYKLIDMAKYSDRIFLLEAMIPFCKSVGFEKWIIRHAERIWDRLNDSTKKIICYELVNNNYEITPNIELLFSSILEFSWPIRLDSPIFDIETCKFISLPKEINLENFFLENLKCPKLQQMILIAQMRAYEVSLMIQNGIITMDMFRNEEEYLNLLIWLGSSNIEASIKNLLFMKPSDKVKEYINNRDKLLGFSK